MKRSLQNFLLFSVFHLLLVLLSVVTHCVITSTVYICKSHCPASDVQSNPTFSNHNKRKHYVLGLLLILEAHKGKGTFRRERRIKVTRLYRWERYRGKRGTVFTNRTKYVVLHQQQKFPCCFSEEAVLVGAVLKVSWLWPGSFLHSQLERLGLGFVNSDGGDWKGRWVIETSLFI